MSLLENKKPLAQIKPAIVPVERTNGQVKNVTEIKNRISSIVDQCGGVSKAH